MHFGFTNRGFKFIPKGIRENLTWWRVYVHIYLVHIKYDTYVHIFIHVSIMGDF